MPPHERPPEVLKAIRQHDHEALKALGKAGAEAKHNKRAALDMLHEKELEEHAAEESQHFTVSDEGDVLPPLKDQN